MAEPEKKETKTVDLDALITEKKAKLQQERQKKKEERVEKVKPQKGASITIIGVNNNANVILNGLHKVTDADVQKLVAEAVGVKNVPVSRKGSTWMIKFSHPNKANELVKKLDGCFCKESGKNLSLRFQGK